MLPCSCRLRTANIVYSQTFEMVMGIVILINVATIIYEANLDASCYPEFVENYSACPWRSGNIGWLSALNAALLVIYSLECFARLYVERTQFLCNRWNMLDFTTVLLGWTSVLLAATTDSAINLGLFRLLRLVRVLRAIRILIAIPEFYLLVTGLWSAIKAIFFGSAMLLLVIVFWAVVSVEMFHPVLSVISSSTCRRCQKGFSNVFQAAVTLFQQTLGLMSNVFLCFYQHCLRVVSGVCLERLASAWTTVAALEASRPSVHGLSCRPNLAIVGV